ncbi:hypothetical protein [Gordonia sp. (in: high G+C Gram-positive bacteria)]|uniref:hypothetical protein n=1 Tax=Gordonia sp. (in: high G+C Gram-positive bacteria) TaxID=84139 RepID=UPI0039E5014E
MSALLSAVVCFPLFGGYLLHRDAVATPTSPLTAAAFGIDGAPPRAVPQDGAVAVASHVVDGGVLVAAVIALSLFAAGVGYGRLARRLVPGAGNAGAVAAAVVAIWNPYVAERLLQGHWSLLTGYAALGWIVLSVLSLREDPGWRRWAGLTGLFAVAGLTPTGSLLALAVAVAAWVSTRTPSSSGSTIEGTHSPSGPTTGGTRSHTAVEPGRRRSAATTTPRVETSTLLVPVLWLLTASPWLVGAAVADSTTTGSGSGLFAARAEPGLGTFGSVLGLGGIWNAAAVPVSRTSGWAAVATGCLLLVVVGGTVVVIRQRRELDRVVGALAVLAAVTIVAVTLLATTPGDHLIDALTGYLPGAGLVRDTTKYLALAVPFYAIAAAAAVSAVRRWLPAAVGTVAVALLVAAPLPDLAWGVGGGLRAVDYPAAYARVAALIGHSDRAVAVIPSTLMRDYRWNDGPSLSPLPRMIDAPVILDGSLIVDCVRVDAPTGRARQVIDAVDDGADPARLAVLGVGWVVTETRDGVSVAPIDGAPPYPSPATGAWIAAGTAHGIWLAALLAGLASAVAGFTSRRTRAKSSAVDGHE